MIYHFKSADLNKPHLNDELNSQSLNMSTAFSPRMQYVYFVYFLV